MNWLLSLPLGVQLACGALAVLGLWRGAEWVIRGATQIARRAQISEMIIGLTIVSIGSSLPEIFVNIGAGLRGDGSVGVGNIVGSCFVQISFVLGLCVLIGGAMSESRRRLMRDGFMLLGSIVLVWLFGLDGTIEPWEALVLLGLYAGYLGVLLLRVQHPTPDPQPVHDSVARSLAYAAGGLFVVWLSSEVLITLLLYMGAQLGFNAGLIGIISGIGTSVPELAISLIALLQHRSDLSMGNLLGSNITDPLLSMPLGVILAGGYDVSRYLTWTAIPIWAGASTLVMVLLLRYGNINRRWGMALVVYYLLSFFVLV